MTTTTATGKLDPAPGGDVAAPAVLSPAPRPRRGRQGLLLGGGALLLLAAAGGGLRLYLTRGVEGTDDAQVEADVVALAPRVGGQVAAVLVAEDSHVAAGQPLLRLDDADLRARLRQAQAELATARAQVRSARAQAQAARAGLSRSQVEEEKARLDLQRAEVLRQGDVLAAQGYDAARIQRESAEAGTGANQAQVQAALAGVELAQAREEAAAAALELARLQLSYTVVRAPAAGTVSRLAARVGLLVQTGQALGQLVPDGSYILANFKETQAGGLRPGQRAHIRLDAYPGLVLEGRVESLAAGTGGRFALLPADNASGNFVKVVERVPVRIGWASPPPGLALRAGLSADVEVLTR